MKFIKGDNRTQINLFPVSLEHAIDEDNEVRIIDLFVDSISLEDYGFKTKYVENGRPAYHPSDLLKLYIYGYLNKIRTSRDLEKECKRNIEMIWLIKALKPDHNTISNFRMDNPKAIKKVFRATVQIAKHFDLIGGDIKWLTKVPTKEDGIKKYLPFSQVTELLGHGFFWARTIKTPYLSKVESDLLLDELIKITR